MQNLRDKLLKAGLVTSEQAKEAESQKSAARKPQSAPNRATDAPIPKLPPLALPGSKAYQRLESLKQQELQKRIREIVKAAEVPLSDGEVSFHFMTRKGKLRRLQLTAEQAKGLEEGKLAIVERPEPAFIEHAIVPRATAEELLALSEKAVRFFNKDGKPIGFLSDEELQKPASTEAEANDAPEGEADAG